MEKVQGDECDHLIISLGYGMDEEGQFHKKFGPLNKESGKNRLNVLFSRASEQIDFVCYIRSGLLKWSSNPAVELLYKWLKQIEKPQNENTISLPPAINWNFETNSIVIPFAYQTFHNALELKTTYEVLRSRGWEIVLE